MKKTKPPSQTPDPLPSSNSPFQIPKRPLIFPSATISSQYNHNIGYISTNLNIRNYHFFKIHFNGKAPSPKSATKIFKRNAKYLKGTKEYQFRSSPPASLYKSVSELERTPTKFSDLRSGSKTIIEFSKLLLKINLAARTLKIDIPLLAHDDAQRSLCEKRLQEIFQMMRLSNLKAAIIRYQLNQESTLKEIGILNNINVRTTLRLQLDLRGGLKSESFYNVFEVLSHISHLEALKISVDLSEADKKGQNMKKIIAKFDKLKHLNLQLTFETDVKENSNLLGSLGSFKSLRYLNLGLYANSTYLKKYTVHHSDAIKFVVAHKNLETLKFKADHMRFDEYVELFQGIQKMKALTKLCVVQIDRAFPMSFGYGIVFKTLEALKKLKKLHLDLGYYGCDGNEIGAIFRHLLKHSSLKELKISLKMDSRSNHPYKFDDEFYENLRELRKKLSYGLKLNLIIFDQPEYLQVFEKASKIIKLSDSENQSFACSRQFC